VGGAFYTLSSGLVVAAGKGKSERAVVNHKRSTCSFAMCFAGVERCMGYKYLLSTAQASV
jgi:hypothetical protein